jgi:adenylate kinase
VLKSRLGSREYKEGKIRENVEAEALDSCLIETADNFRPDQIFELDTTSRDTVSCADMIEQFIQGKIPPGFGTLDWSGFLEVY